MDIAIVQPFLNRMGGAERVVLKMAQHYNALIYVVDYDKDRTFPEFKNLDVRVIPSPKWVNLFKFLPHRIFLGFKYGAVFHSYKFKEKYDFIIANYSPSEWLAIKNKNVVWYCHSPLRDVYDLYDYRKQNGMKFDQWYYKFLVGIFRNIDKKAVSKIKIILTNSQNVQNRIRKYLNRNAKIIYPCIDTEKYRNDGDGKYFLYVSRFVPQKRQDYIVRAFERFHSMYDENGEYSLILAGGVSEDIESINYVRGLKEFIGDNPLIKIIENPPDNDVINLYSKCTAFLFAGLDEDFGIVPIEAMASGKVVISVNEGGPKEYIVDKENGFLAPNIEIFAESMDFIKSRGMLAKNMGEQAKNTAITMFSCVKFFEKLDEALRQFKYP